MQFSFALCQLFWPKLNSFTELRFSGSVHLQGHVLKINKNICKVLFIVFYTNEENFQVLLVLCTVQIGMARYVFLSLITSMFLQLGLVDILYITVDT
jgi:hypothetical protein